MQKSGFGLLGYYSQTRRSPLTQSFNKHGKRIDRSRKPQIAL